MAEVIARNCPAGLPTTTQRRSALVFGGGLAGIAASVGLAQAGWAVTLLEARSALGGRVFSFRDPQGGRVLDNGQHVIVGACTNLITFLEAIGARHLWHIQPQLDVTVYDRRRRLGRLYGVSAPAPFHLLPAFLSYPHLGWLDKVKTVRGLVSMMRARRNNPDLEAMTFYDWLRARGQPERVVSNLWNVLVEGTLNDNIKAVSASMGLMIVREGLLAGKHTANVGYPTAPLNDALTQPAAAYLKTLGVSIVTGCSVRCVNTYENRVVESITVGDGNDMRADMYVSAVPFWTLTNLLSGAMAESSTVRRLSNLQTSPIVNVHLLYDRPVMSCDFCYFLESPLQWVFNSTRIFGDGIQDNRQSLSVSVSAAWEYIDMERSQFAQTIAHEMSDAFPEARHATLLEAVVVKQRNATFRCTPGANGFRPGPHTESPNLFLAGEWTNTGWPSTMESALISGYNAAHAVMASTAVPFHSENHSVGSMG
jgi:squalene-associated FAD-dependent desaturase